MLLRSLITVLALFMVTGCANKPTSPEQAQAPVQPRSAPPQPQQTSPHDRARLHTELAAGYYERGQMDVAIDELKISVSLDPNYAQTYNIYGLVYAVLGEDRNAEQNFEHALQLAPNDSETHHNWGWYLCQHKREREALGQFELAVRNPLYRSPEVALVNAGRWADKNKRPPLTGRLEMAPQGLLCDYGGTLVEEVSVDLRAGNEWLLSRASFRPASVSLEQVLERASRVTTEVAGRRDGVHLEAAWPALTRLIHDFFGIRFDAPMAELEMGFGRRRCRRGRCRELVRRLSSAID